MKGDEAAVLSCELPELLRQITDQLTQAGVPSPRVDAELLLGHVLGLSRGEVQAAALTGRKIEPDVADRLHLLVEERTRRVPLQHLTGLAPFRNLELRVGPGVFIPRPETEQVVQVVLDRLHRHGPVSPAVIDLGTGSGAIAASIAAEHPAAQVQAVELSDQAAAWAELNLQPHGVALHRCDLRRLPAEWEDTFDVVVSNPPYIPALAEPTEVEVRDHDPEVALYGGGADGLDMPRQVIAAAGRLLKDGGWFIMEHAEAQAEALARICAADPTWGQVETHQDLSGRPRATSAVKTGLRQA